MEDVWNMLKTIRESALTLKSIIFSDVNKKQEMYLIRWLADNSGGFGIETL